MITLIMLLAYLCFSNMLYCMNEPPNKYQKKVFEALKKSKEYQKKARDQFKNADKTSANEIKNKKKAEYTDAQKARINRSYAGARTFIEAAKNAIQKFEPNDIEKLLNNPQHRKGLIYNFEKLTRCTWQKKHCQVPISGIKPSCPLLLNECISDLCDPDNLTANLRNVLDGPDESWPERRIKAMTYLCAGADPEIYIHGYATPLIVGILHNDTEFVEFCLKNIKVDPNGRSYFLITKDDRNSTKKTFKNPPGKLTSELSAASLNWAVMTGRKPKLVKLLVQYQATNKPRDTKGYSPLKDLIYHCRWYKSTNDILQKARYLTPIVNHVQNQGGFELDYANQVANRSSACQALAQFLEQSYEKRFA